MATKTKKTNPLKNISPLLLAKMKNQAGYRERDVLSHAKKVTFVGENIKVDTGRKTGSPTDFGIFNTKRKAWIG